MAYIFSMPNTRSFKAFSFIVALLVRLIHLPIIYFYVSFGIHVGKTIFINIIFTFVGCVLAWYIWKLWHRPSVRSDEYIHMQYEELQWLLEHQDRAGYLRRTWNHIMSEPVLLKMMLEPIFDTIIKWNIGCYTIGWLCGFFDRFSYVSISTIEVDIMYELTHVSFEIIHDFIAVIILFVVEFVLFASYVIICMYADSSTLKTMAIIDKAKR